MVKEPKIVKSFFWALFINFFHNYKLLLFHVYQLHPLIYGFKFIWELKKLEPMRSQKLMNPNNLKNAQTHEPNNVKPKSMNPNSLENV